jgi:surfeit locus 1 family protein
MRVRWGWIASIALFSLMVLFVWLGMWQLDRVAEKEQLLLERQQRGTEQLWSLTGDENDPDSMRYRSVEVVGEMISDQQFLLDNRKYKRMAGYHVLVPMQINGSEQAVLVNRGWVAQGASRQQLPQIPVPAGQQRIEGVVRVPTVHGFRMEQEPGAPRRLYIDLPQISEMIGVPLLSFVVQQQQPSEGQPMDTLIRKWQAAERDHDPQMHMGYAVQWFAFALLLAGGWVALWFRQNRSDKE